MPVLGETLMRAPLGWAAPPPPQTPSTPGDPQLCPSWAILADVSWLSPSAFVPEGPAGWDRCATGHRVTQQQDSTQPGLALHPQPSVLAVTQKPKQCHGSPMAASAPGKGSGLFMEAFSTALAVGGTPLCCLPAPCTLGNQLKSRSHRQAGAQCPASFLLLQAPIPGAYPSLPLHSDVASSQRAQAAWRSLPLKGKVFPDEVVSSQLRERMEGRGACGGRVDGKTDSILPPSGPIPSMPCTSQSPARVPCPCRKFQQAALSWCAEGQVGTL